MSRVVVIGAGIMGLTAAYRAAISGHQVDVVEAAAEPGGMAGHFDLTAFPSSASTILSARPTNLPSICWMNLD